jgi:hypothetical protein
MDKVFDVTHKVKRNIAVTLKSEKNIGMLYLDYCVLNFFIGCVFHIKYAVCSENFRHCF